MKDPTYAIFLKSWGFKDVKYDIPIQLGTSHLYVIILGEIEYFYIVFIASVQLN